MELKIIHFYPDLMSLYGSYANVSVLRRYLEALAAPSRYRPLSRGRAQTSPAPTFSLWGAGTERAQRFAAGGLRPV